MNYADLAREMIRIWNMSEGMRQAQISLITSPFAKSIRSVWVGIYYWTVGKKLIQKIESLDPESKKELWNNTKDICGPLDKETMIEVSKALYTIEFYLNENEKTNPIRETKEESARHL